MNFSELFHSGKQLKDYTTFGIGGPARHFIEIRKVEEMQKLISYCSEHSLRYFILGKGSNCLFDDRGFDGLVILNKIDFFEELAPQVVHVGAGYSFSLLGVQTARKGFAGLEFASGIPGSVGGAVFMNAGANGIETCQSLLSVDFVNEQGLLEVLNRKDLHFAYRHSPFQNKKGAIVGATFGLTEFPEARQKQIDIINYRKKTQPLTEMSAGCIFRNPQNGFSGALIEKSQLKGKGIGDAKVSEIHANFIVNKGTATSKEVLSLINMIKEQVKSDSGIELESEVRCIPYSGDIE